MLKLHVWFELWMLFLSIAFWIFKFYFVSSISLRFLKYSVWICFTLCSVVFIYSVVNFSVCKIWDNQNKVFCRHGGILLILCPWGSNDVGDLVVCSEYSSDALFFPNSAGLDLFAVDFLFSGLLYARSLWNHCEVVRF